MKTDAKTAIAIIDIQLGAAGIDAAKAERLKARRRELVETARSDRCGRETSPPVTSTPDDEVRLTPAEWLHCRAVALAKEYAYAGSNPERERISREIIDTESVISRLATPGRIERWLAAPPTAGEGSNQVPPAAGIYAPPLIRAGDIAADGDQPDPSPAEISERAETIQKSWSEAERTRREHDPHLERPPQEVRRELRWKPPRFANPIRQSPITEPDE